MSELKSSGRKWTPEQRKLLDQAGKEVARDVARERLYQARKALAMTVFPPLSRDSAQMVPLERDVFAYQLMLLRTELEIIADKWMVDEAAMPFGRRLLKLLEETE